MADVKATVLLSTYRWTVDGEVQEASRGDEITVSSAEYDRAQAMTPTGLAKGDVADSDYADTPVELPKDLSELSKKELTALAGQLGLDVSGLKTEDALVGAIAAAPGYERPNQ